MEEMRETIDGNLSELLSLAEADVRNATEEERARAVKAYCDLYDRYVESVKLDQNSSDSADKYLLEYRKQEIERERLEAELERKNEEVKQAKKEGWIKLGLGVLGTAVPLLFQDVWMRRLWKAEEFGSITGQTSRQVFQNLFRRK